MGPLTIARFYASRTQIQEKYFYSFILVANAMNDLLLLIVQRGQNILEIPRMGCLHCVDKLVIT
jgi:hypothetical protein